MYLSHAVAKEFVSLLLITSVSSVRHVIAVNLFFRVQHHRNNCNAQYSCKQVTV